MYYLFGQNLTKALTVYLVFIGICFPGISVQAQVAKENLRPAALGKRGMVATANPLAS
jgi:gamma-glutamyltranspeptidase/glutathione hydrolase